MEHITILGVGFEADQLTLRAVSLLKSGKRVVLHTDRCGCAEWLRTEGISFSSLDDLYEQCEDFSEHAELAAERVMNAAENEETVYCVFDVRDESVATLLRRVPAKKVTVIAGPPQESGLYAYCTEMTLCVSASDWEHFSLSSARATLVRELDSRELASEVKLKLTEVYPDEETVYILRPDGTVARTGLYNLDRMRDYDHRCSVFVPAVADLMALQRYDFERLCEIIHRLCAPDGCPWDREQTHESLRRYIIEEAYEAVDAIDADDPDHLYDELGDMMLQILLHADIGTRYGEFDILDVTTAISEKMIRRHTHIFGADRVGSAEEVTQLWTRNKMQERGQTRYSEVLADITPTLPAALRASKLFKRIDEVCGRKESADSAMTGLAKAYACFAAGVKDERAFGQLLLAMVNAARAEGVDPELALNAAIERTIERFTEMERGRGPEEISAEEKNKYWDSVKLSYNG